jgi:hypothetical protein
MPCLYPSDYGPPEPGFNPSAEGGRLLAGFEAHAQELSHATNLAQLEAMERHLQRGQDIVWCDQGYGWTYSTPVEGLFGAILFCVILPYAVWRTRKRFAGRRAGALRTGAPAGFLSAIEK